MGVAFWALTAQLGAAPDLVDGAINPPQALIDSILPGTPEMQIQRRSDEVPTLNHLWLSQGPGPIRNGQVENVQPNNEVVGAIHTVLAHPTDPDVLYIGAVNGGIWKTTNATAASPDWQPLTDHLSSLSIGAMAFDPSDPDTIVAGINRSSGFAEEGGPLDGLLMTEDGGETWSLIEDLTDLRSLSLHSNSLNTLVPETFAHLAGLEYLSLRNNALSGPGVRTA